MKGFAGFPAGKVRFTPLPNLFFSELLPLIDNLAELKVTLHVFWRLHGKRGYPRYVSRKELLADGVLLSGLKSPGRKPEDILGEGLERAVARGTLLRLITEGRDGQEEWYFPNTDLGRRTVDRIRRGELELAATPVAEAPPQVERPNIFVLYEQNIGLLQPMIAEELREAEQTYPAAWIEEAFKIAVERNARNWRYIQRILERWAREGKDDGKPEGRAKKDRRRYIEGEYAEYIEH
ncbi:MAG: DnaD domain-containing protein [Anaerolineae bacterium]